MNTWKLGHLTLKAVREQPYEVAVIPLGSCEPHNFHLPYACDTIQSEGLADRTCEAATNLGAKVVLLPAIPFGVQSNMLELPLAINVYPSTMLALLKDIVESLENSGIHKVVLWNGHGGNDWMKPFIREMMGRSKVFICTLDWYRAAKDHYDEIFAAPDDHAGELETSLNLALVPHLVHLEDAGDGAWKKSRFEAVNQGWVSLSRPWDRLTPSTGVGDPRAASAQKGEQYMAIAVERLSHFLLELSQSPLDETFPF